MITFGDYILYGMCDGEYKGEKTIKHTDRDIVAGKIWLIGRSYAASPERNLWKEPKTIRIKEAEKQLKGNTDTDFFKKFANFFVRDERRKELDDTISQLQEHNKYEYIFENDKHILEKIVHLVMLFNEMIKDASIQHKKDKYEKIISELNETELMVKNNIIFASKYLHFHLPKIVYIMDGNSRKNSKEKYEKLYNKENKQIFDDFERKFPFNDGYVKHILHCHFIAQELNADNKECTPRDIDNILMRRG